MGWPNSAVTPVASGVYTLRLDGPARSRTLAVSCALPERFGHRPHNGHPHRLRKVSPASHEVETPLDSPEPYPRTSFPPVQTVGLARIAVRRGPSAPDIRDRA